MKILALFTIFVLVTGTLSTSLVSDAYAQNDPNILKRIAQGAENQIIEQIDTTYGDNPPSDIQDKLALGQEQVRLLVTSLESSDVEKAKEHFLSAMKHFKQITRMISSPAAESRLDTSAQTIDRDLLSELNRLVKYVDSIKTVSAKHNTGINFEKIDSLIDQARSELNNGTGNPSQTIDQIKNLIKDIKKNIREHASQSSPDRVKQFVEKQLNGVERKLTKALDAGADPSQVEEAHGLIDEIQTMIAEDKIDDAKQVFRELINLVKQIERSVR